MNTEDLSIICAGLRANDDGEDDDEFDVKEGYNRSEYCLDNLKDLLRFLRRDDPETRDVFKQVCKWNIVGNDLIPIIVYCQDDRNLVLNAVKVLVFLTMPIDASSKDVNDQLDYLWGIKSAITHSDVVAVVVSLLEKPLENLECMAFSEDDWKLVQLVLTFFRNILAVQEISVHQAALGSANQLISLRDDFLERLFKENVMDLIIIITQHVSGACRYLRHDNLLLLEIYHYIYMGQDPELIAKMKDLKADEDAKSGLDSLESLMQEEAAKRRLARLHASRHSQFGGSFTRLTLDGSKTMCKGTPSPASCDKLLKPEKVHRGPSKRVVKDYTRLPTTKRSLLEMLLEFSNQFLTGGYNVLMQSIAEDIEKEHPAIQTSDVLMFFHLAQFVTSFQYHKSVLTKHTAEANSESTLGDDEDNDDDSTWFKGDICGPVAATMNDSMFGLVIAKWQLAFDGLKETKNTSFLSVAGSLMKIMIRMLDLVLKVMPEQSKEPQTARIILYKLFYDQTDMGLTQFLLNMVKSFDAHKQPKSDLADLVEIMHVIIRLMEKLQAQGTLRVAKKARKVKRKKTDNLKNTDSGTAKDDVTVQSDNSGSRNEGEDREVTEKGASTLIAGIEDQHVDPPVQNDETHMPVAEDQNVDAPEQNNETEMPVAEGQNSGSSLPLGDHGESDQAHDNVLVTGALDCDSSEDDQPAATNEVDFKMTSWLFQLASSTIISNLCWLLKFYKSNSPATNHYVVSLLRRICDDLDLAPMLYQLSCLVIFYDILNAQKACPQKEYENIVHFLTSLVRRMLRKMKNQPLLFVDVLFWKSRKECQCINVDTMQHEVGEMRKEVKSWGRVADAGPSLGKGNIRKSLADALGDDEYDVFTSSELRQEMDIDKDGAGGEVLHTGDYWDHSSKEHPMEGDSEGVPRKKRRLVLNVKLEEQIRDLFEKHKDSRDCSQLIAEALDPNGNITSAQVSRKCKKLGLQLPSRKSFDVKATAEKDRVSPDQNNLDGPSMHSKKRVRAIDKNQELKIRSLFEQFKDHRRCSHMIAKELDPDGAITPAQVSRKLKKLGLHISRMKGEAGHKMDEADALMVEEDDSDDLTLSLLTKRIRKKDDASIKEFETSNTVQSPEHSSDEEPILSSILKKSRRQHSELETGHVTSFKQATERQVFGERGLEERDDRGQLAAMDVIDDMPLQNSPSFSTDHLATGTDTKYDVSTPSVDQASPHGLASSSQNAGSTNDADSMQNEHKYNELEDSEDEQVHTASPKSSSMRRKLRVVLDFDDDE